MSKRRTVIVFVFLNLLPEFPYKYPYVYGHFEDYAIRDVAY